MPQPLTRFGLLAVAALALIVPAALRAQATADQTGVGRELELHRQRAGEALRANDRTAAEREYRAILALAPRDSAAWTGLGVLQYGEGKAHDASHSLGEALRIDRSAPRAELFLALSQADLGDCSEAAPLLAKHFASEPAGNLQRLTGLALLGCTSDSADPLPAQQTAARLKQLYPGDADVLYASAELYTRLWNESAGELLAAHPDSFRVHQLAGEVYEAQKNYDQAIREYGLALAANPRLPRLHFRIGQLYLQQSGPDADAKAIEEFRLEQAADPNSAVAALAIAEIDRHQHKLDEAKPLYEQAVQLDPHLVEARVGLAQTLIGLHQLGPAVEQLHIALADHPENAQAHYALMLALREQGKLPEAAAEMATFRRLQTASDSNFQGKLNALLNARPQAGDALSK